MIIYSHILLSLFSLVTCSRHGKPCVPTAGHTALIIGQDYYSIRNYTYALGADPFGVMAYTALESSTGSLTGLKMPIDYGSGIEWIEGLVDLYAGISLQVGLYLVNVCPKVLSGELDGNIESLSRYLRSINNPVYLRVGYEFDSFQNNYPTDCYIKMFQRIVNLFRTHKTYNVAFVWHSYVEAPRDNISVDSWYPGDEYVDWCGLSIFNQPYNCQTQHLCEFEYADRFLSFCKSRFKPSMIAESTPYGGIYDYGTSSKNRSIPSVIPNRAYITERASTLPSADGKSSSQPTKLDTWSAWFEHVIVYIKKHDIKIWSYIEGLGTLLVPNTPALVHLLVNESPSPVSFMFLPFPRSPGSSRDFVQLYGRSPRPPTPEDSSPAPPAPAPDPWLPVLLSSGGYAIVFVCKAGSRAICL